MLGWAIAVLIIAFLIIALVAAALGFGGIAGASAGIAQILFFIFLVPFAVALVARSVRGRPPVCGEERTGPRNRPEHVGNGGRSSDRPRFLAPLRVP